MNDTTRRYPRTMQEAFPRDAQWAYAVERTDTRVEALAGVVLAAAIGIGFGLALVAWWAA